MKTYQPKLKDIKRRWILIDMKGQILGRVATQIAGLLMGKTKENYVPHLDMGDYVVIINAKEVVVTGEKSKQKVYRGHSGYPGGLKEVSYKKLTKEQPLKVIEHAVSGMLPDNKLKSERMRRLKIFSDDKHPYSDKIAK